MTRHFDRYSQAVEPGDSSRMQRRGRSSAAAPQPTRSANAGKCFRVVVGSCAGLPTANRRQMEATPARSVHCSPRSSGLSAHLSPSFVASCKNLPGARTFLSATGKLPAIADKNVRAPIWLWCRRAASLRSTQPCVSEVVLAKPYARLLFQKSGSCGLCRQPKSQARTASLRYPHVLKDANRAAKTAQLRLIPIDAKPPSGLGSLAYEKACFNSCHSCRRSEFACLPSAGSRRNHI